MERLYNTENEAVGTMFRFAKVRGEEHLGVKELPVDELTFDDFKWAMESNNPLWKKFSEKAEIMEKDANPNYYQQWRAAVSDYYRPGATPEQRAHAHQAYINAIMGVPRPRLCPPGLRAAASCITEAYHAAKTTGRR